MARWIPPSDRVDRNEHIGRRLFDEPMLVGAQDQKSFRGLLLRHFEERRDDRFSVDRLGRSGVDGAVVKYLQPLAEASGNTFHTPKRFDGWAVLRAHQLGNSTRGTPLSVVAFPENDNPYHAHIETHQLLESEPEPLRHYHIALHLKELFSAKGSLHSVADHQVTSRGLMRLVPSKLKKWLSSLFNVRRV
jgi:hypothetical protein